MLLPDPDVYMYAVSALFGLILFFGNLRSGRPADEKLVWIRNWIGLGYLGTIFILFPLSVVLSVFALPLALILVFAPLSFIGIFLALISLSVVIENKRTAEKLPQKLPLVVVRIIGILAFGLFSAFGYIEYRDEHLYAETMAYNQIREEDFLAAIENSPNEILVSSDLRGVPPEALGVEMHIALKVPTPGPYPTAIFTFKKDAGAVNLYLEIQHGFEYDKHPFPRALLARAPYRYSISDTERIEYSGRIFIDTASNKQIDLDEQFGVEQRLFHPRQPEGLFYETRTVPALIYKVESFDPPLRTFVKELAKTTEGYLGPGTISGNEYYFIQVSGARDSSDYRKADIVFRSEPLVEDTESKGFYRIPVRTVMQSLQETGVPFDTE